MRQSNLTYKQAYLDHYASAHNLLDGVLKDNTSDFVFPIHKKTKLERILKVAGKGRKT